MTVPVEEAVAALSAFSLEDDQPEVQGPGMWIASERSAAESPIGYCDVNAYRISLSEDTKAINQLTLLVQEGKEMCSVLYTYRSCVKALPQLPDSMKHRQAELYGDTFHVLEMEMSRLRKIQQWQALASSKLAADMQRFSRPERPLNGPTVSHLWSMLKLLDVLVQLDHLKNAKASIPNDFSWYKRTFTQVSTHWKDTDSIREELDDLQVFLSTRWAILLNLHVDMFRVNNVEDILQILILFSVESLELNFALLFPERHLLLRVLPVLVVLASSSEKDGESLYKRVNINRLINIFQNDPVIPAFPDLHLSPAVLLKELSTHFQKFTVQGCLLSLPAPHELLGRDAQDYQRQYLVINHIDMIQAEHDSFVVRFASSMDQLLLLKSTDEVDVKWSKEIKENMYDVVVEGFQLLSRWTSRIWGQCAWKFSRPCKDTDHDDMRKTIAGCSDYEKVVRFNYTLDERKSLVQLVCYIKSVGSLLHRSDTLLADALLETIHTQVQDFVQTSLSSMLRNTFRKKKDISRILSDMRTLSADWMANTGNTVSGLDSENNGSDEADSSFFPRTVGPTAAQIHCLQYLIYELVSGGNLKKSGGLFGNSGSDIPANELKLLENFFYKLSISLHILDYTATLATLSDLGFLWFRELFLESSRVIQYPVECSLPWMLVEHVLETESADLIESVLFPFDIYNDSAQQALVVLKQRFLYDEIEAEVDHCFDIFVSRLSEIIYTYYKSWGASKLLDPSFIFVLDDAEKYSIKPMRISALLKITNVKLLGRTINLRGLISGWMNRAFRENIRFLLDRFESQDLCAIVELERLLDTLKSTHEILSRELSLDSFTLMLDEMQENLSVVSYSSRLASQIWMSMQRDFLPHFILCNTTRRFVRSPEAPPAPAQKPSVPHAKANFYYGSPSLNSAHQSFTRMYSGFFGSPHMLCIVKLLGSRSLPWLIRALLDHISNKISVLDPMVTSLQEALPKTVNLLPNDGVAGCMKVVRESLNLGSRSEVKIEVLRGAKEIGSALYWISLLDVSLKETGTIQFLQIAPWLGIVPGADGQLLHTEVDGESPLVALFKSAVSNSQYSKSSSFCTITRQAEAADVLYKASMNNGSVLEYALAFTSAALGRYFGKWSASPRTGFVDIATSKDFYRVFSALQIGHLVECLHSSPPCHDELGDSLAWGACTIIYLLGQQLHFELFDFSYQVLNVAEMDALTISQSHKKLLQDWEPLLEAMKKSRRLNNHVFSVLKARCPLEDKKACAIKQSGMPLHQVAYENTVSAFESLPQKKVSIG